MGAAARRGAEGPAELRVGGGAEVGLAAHAELAHTAPGRDASDHVVAGGKVRHALADLFHHTRRLMAENAGRRQGDAPFDHVKVAVADPRCGGANQHLPRLGLLDDYVFDHQGARWSRA